MKPQILFAFILLFGAGCASNYQRAWDNAAGKSAVIRSANSGNSMNVPARWSGTWLSEKSGHKGTLRCILLPTENPDEIHTWFDSTYAKVLRFKMKSTFPTELAITPPTTIGGTIESLRFSGSDSLGIFGVYEREGEISGDTFRSSYRAKHDHGVFEMRAAD